MTPEAERALDLLAPCRSLLLAVSGGPDSVALMLLCAGWRDRASHDIAVATVDHGLRPESRAEAERVGDWARALGFAQHLLTWTGDKPATRIQERARDARYRLLADCAQRIGADAIVTAHHADDQAGRTTPMSSIPPIMTTNMRASGCVSWRRCWSRRDLISGR